MRKRKFILQLIVTGLLSCIFISFPAWFTSQRVIPSIPIISLLEDLPFYVNNFVTLILLSSLFLTLFVFKYEQFALKATLLALCISCLFDQIRVQPWVFSYAFMLLSFILYSEKKKAFSYTLIQIVLALGYFWSGIQKLNISFIEGTFPWMIEPLLNIAPFLSNVPIQILAISAAIIEAFFGLGLLFQKLRKISVITLVLMHLFILLMLSPIGHNHNEVVWPWNISYIILLFILFWNTEAITYKSFVNKHDKLIFISYLLIFGFMPLFSFVNLWPKYFSAALYSDNKIKTDFYISDELKEEWSESVNEVIQPFDNKINLTEWALEELKLPPYPSIDYSIKMFDIFCESSTNEADVILIIKNEPSITSTERPTESYFCSD